MSFRLRRGAAIALPILTGIAVLGLVQGCSKDDPKDAGPGGNKGRLQDETHTAWAVDEDPATGTPDLVVALDPIPPIVVKGNYEAAARAWLDQHKDMYKLTDIKGQLITLDVILASDKTAHVRFQQREGGLRVERAIIAVHFRPDGSIGLVNATVAPDAAKAIGSPTVTEQQAIASAESALKAAVPDYTPAALSAPPAAKLILSATGAGAVLGWRFTLDGRTPASGAFGMSFLVDARTGVVVEAAPTLHEVTARGIAVKGDTKSFEVSTTKAGAYEMKVGGGVFGGFGILATSITTMDANQGNAVVSSTKLEEGWDRAAVGPGAAVDAHTFVTGADKYFRDHHGWASYNGWGGALKVFAHDNALANNAWWDAKDGLHFSDGDASKGFLPRSAGPDTVGHEFMHGITQHTAGLTYAGESGALNESISDIMGSYVEAELQPGDRYTHPDQSGPAYRDLAHPTAKGQPDNVKNQVARGEAATDKNDHGGVHSNSGIPNNTWYLMTNGGTNDTSKIPVLQSIGLDSSRALWWATVRYLLNSSATFDRAARWQTAFAFITLRPVEAVGCAWVATGVLENKYIKSTYKVKCYCELPDGGVQQPEDMQCCKAGQKQEEDCCKPCEDAAPPIEAGAPTDGGTPSDPTGKKTDPDLFDSCTGRADGVYCSQLASYSAIVCQGESIALGIQCENERKCLGPNGPGTQVQCEGGGNLPPVPSPDGGTTPTADSCEGRQDGVYCSTLAPYSAYECQGGTIAGGQQCADNKRCVGPNGPGKLQCQ